jgi:hypothetical protein
MTEPIRPPTVGITPEAAEHLIQNGYLATDLEADDNGDIPIEVMDDSPFMNMAQAFAREPANESFTSDGDVIDAEIVDDSTASDASPSSARTRRGRSTASDEPPTPRTAKTGPPSLDEWTRFFSRVVLRVGTEFYISVAFRGIDEDALSDRDVERLAMTDDERQLIAVPFAELSNKSKFMRKHGRMIVASGDAFNAVVVLGMWMSRVNRIAAKIRLRQPKVVGGNVNGSSRPGSPAPGGTPSPEGATGGRFPPGFNGRIFPGTG